MADMRAERCKYALRKRGDVSLHCELLAQEKFSQCIHQYYCNNTGRWEASPSEKTCRIKTAEHKRGAEA